MIEMTLDEALAVTFIDLAHVPGVTIFAGILAHGR